MEVLVNGDLLVLFSFPFPLLIYQRGRKIWGTEEDQRKMDSRKIFSVFLFFSFLILSHHQSHARVLKRGPPDAPASAPAPTPWPSCMEGCCCDSTLTACIHVSSTGSKTLLVSVKNDGDEVLNVTVTSISHGEHSIQGQPIEVQGHKAQEIKVSANLGANSSIQVDAGKLACKIPVRSSASGGGSFGNVNLGGYITPTNGAYFLFVTGLIFGTTLAYSKWGKSGQHGDGISYQQLEMGRQPDSPSASANNVETAGGWEQDWDGDWDELKLKSKAAKESSANSLTSRTSKRDGH